MADAAEALETVRDARQRLRPGEQPAVSAKPKRKGKGKVPAKSIAERKANSTCKACGGRGHWSGDRECPRTAGGASAQSVHVTAAGDDDSQVVICKPAAAVTFFKNEFPETITNVQELSETYVLSANALNETDPDAGHGIFDTACALSVAGCAWTRHYLSTLQCLGLSHMVQEDVATKTFRFGDGHGAQCNRRVTAPVVIANQPLMLRWHVLDGYKLSLLLGQDFIAQTGAIFDGKKHKLSIDGRTWSLGRSKRGHFSVNLHPEHYTALRAASLERTRFEALPRRVANPSRLGDLMSLICTSVEKLTEVRTVNAASSRRDANSAELVPAYRKDASEMPCRVCYQHSSAACMSCGGPLCAACASGTRCALCTHGREEFHVGGSNYQQNDSNYQHGDSNYPHGDSNRTTRTATCAPLVRPLASCPPSVRRPGISRTARRRSWMQE